MSRYNVGADILKVLSCMGVVYLHFGAGKSAAAQMSVPIFVLVSFYLCGNHILFGSGKDLGRRVWRLYCPFLFWGIVYFLIKSVFSKTLDLGALCCQLVFGAPLCPVLYFIVDLVAVSVVLFCLAKLLRRWVDHMLCCAIVICMMLEYLGFNYSLFSELPYYAKWTVGRFCELVPYACVGLICYRYAQYRKVLTALSVVLLLFWLGLRFFGVSLSAPGFMYSGVLLLVGATSISVLALLASWNIPIQLIKIIKAGGGITAGVYYLHLLVGFGLNRLEFSGEIMWVAVFIVAAAVTLALKQSRFTSWVVR